MHYRVTRFASLVPLLIGLAASGCGEVQSGVCAGEQVDEIACTVDICDGEAKAWAHIPNDDLCESGQRCDSTAGCVAAGGLTGHAFLYGHTDHSGITVSVDGIENATTTTDAMGNWSLGALPTGTFTVTYTKATYYTEQQAGVGVLPAAATSPPDVELRRGDALGNDQRIDTQSFFSNADYYNGIYYSPDKKHVVVRYSASPTGTYYRAYKLDGRAASVHMFFDSYQYQPQMPFWVTNTHTIWVVASQTVWSRPLDGGPAVILGSVAPNESITVVGQPLTYVVMRKQRTTGFTEHSLFIVKADGSVPMGSPVWVTPDATHTYRNLVSNETTALLFLDNSSASPPTDGAANIPLRRIDLATGAVSNVNTGFATNVSDVWSVSPDGQTVFGYLRQSAPNNWYRSFLIPLSGTAGPKLAPDYGAGTTQYSDYPSSPVWFADNSGIVYQSSAYTKADAAVAEGGLKVWNNAAATSTTLVAYQAYASWSVHNKVVVYRDANSVLSPLRVVSAHSGSPVSYPLDTTGFYTQDVVFDDSSPTSSYMVWTESVSAGDPTRAKIFAVSMPQPLLAAPTVTQLGGTLSAACQYEAVLSNTTYWQLCRDTGVMNGFTASTASAGTQTTSVRTGLTALPEAGRVAFRKYDGKLYSSPNMGALTEVKLISALWDGQSAFRARGKAIFFNDVDGRYLRASNADGSAIDEPLSSCRFTNTPYQRGMMASDNEKTHVLFTQVSCGDGLFGEYQIPMANVP